MNGQPNLLAGTEENFGGYSCNQMRMAFQSSTGNENQSDIKVRLVFDSMTFGLLRKSPVVFYNANKNPIFTRSR